MNGHSGVDDDPANLLLSNKTKLQHLSEEEREHLNRSVFTLADAGVFLRTNSRLFFGQLPIV